MLTHAGWIRKITLDKRPSAILALLSAAYAIQVVSSRQTFAGIFFFISGAAIVYPPISGLWADIKKNWEKEYKKFFYGTISAEARNKTILKHWGRTWWTAPYLLIVYGYCAFVAIYLGKPYAALLFSGSLFMTGLASYQAQSRIAKPS